MIMKPVHFLLEWLFIHVCTASWKQFISATLALLKENSDLCTLNVRKEIDVNEFILGNVYLFKNKINFSQKERHFYYGF